MARQARAFHPGPIDPTLLVCQETHRSRAVWSDPDYDTVVRVAQYDVLTRENQQACDPRMVEYLRQAGLFGVSHLTTILVDHGLISALLERWRPEVHAFHMPFGEVGITLQDVEVLFGLKVEGLPVTGYDQGSVEGWQALCTELLGFTPGLQSIKGSKIMSAAIPEVPQLTVTSTDEEVQVATRRLIFHLLGGFFFTETRKRYVKLYLLPLLRDFKTFGNYSWGSAVLAYLYRALCRVADYHASTVCGCMVLLQLWAWERLPMVRPQSVLPVEQLGDLPLGARWVCSCGYRNVTSHVVRTYRDQLDRTYERNFEFTPYDLVMPILPDYCKAGGHACGLQKQFSGFQDVPRPVQYRRDLHGTNGRTSKKIVNWAQKHFDYLEAWYNWEDHVIQMQEPSGEKKVSDAYISWYLCCGRHQIGKPEISSSYTELAYGLLWVGRRGRRALDNPNPAEIEQARREMTERIEQLLEGVEASPYAYLLHVPDEILNAAPNPYEPIQDNRRNLQRESEQLER